MPLRDSSVRLRSVQRFEFFFFSYSDFSSMNPMLDLIPGKKGFTASKLAALLAGILFAGALAWLAVPCVTRLLAAVGPGFWITARASIAPSYLFVAVNLIIIAIWNLSEKRATNTGHRPEEESNTDPTPISLKSKDLASSLSASPSEFLKTPSNPTENDEECSPALRSESSCVTTESEEKSTATSRSSLVLSDPALTSVDPVAEEAPAAEDWGVNDSLDATWNAIMRKSGRGERSSLLQAHKPSKWPDPVSAAASGGDAMSMCNDEMDQRFEEFIQKNYDQIRLRNSQKANQRWLVGD
ncbi:hypothetical protein AXF42_Ash017244 [Apostasia shenzhenica]|uniref:DUF4408 domain-containing protein n=1 Tax=Apostasia shenzhenica TaxID=1088818 RepID=A0A2H9ZVF7_9ASPA|nr:hypothetical protein AXF42_Ash017244 [Apostasia shenzhenica]